MIPRELKEKATQLRRAGKSYDFISKETGIASGMLSYWFSKLDWSKRIAQENSLNQIKNSRGKILAMNKARSKNLDEKYDKARQDAILEFEMHKNDILFAGGLMLYSGEGSKSLNTSSIRISNTDPYVLKIFMNFTMKYCKIPKENMKFWLLSYPDLDEVKCLDWWKQQLKLGNENLYKTQVIQGKHKTKRLLYGVGNIIIPGKAMKIKLLKWMELMSVELS